MENMPSNRAVTLCLGDERGYIFMLARYSLRYPSSAQTLVRP